MQNLQTLFLGNCYNIPHLPAKIVNLKNLVTLNLYNFGAMTRLPENFHHLESLQVLSLQGCEKLVELPEELAMCPSLNTLTLWGCIVLTRMPDLTPLLKLQIDGVPEQLADWEAEQKKKRCACMRLHACVSARTQTHARMQAHACAHASTEHTTPAHRAEDLREGKNKPGGQQPAKTSQWETVKKDAARGSVAGAAVAALSAGTEK